MKKNLQSSVFGQLKREEELPEHPAFTAEIDISGHGTASVTLIAMPDDEPDWQTFLRAAEESHPVLLEHESAIRQQAAPQILTKHRDYYEDEWRGSAVDLVSAIRLTQLNFFSDGRFELWYSGGETFHHQDVRIGLDSDMRITEVGFDG